MMISMNKLRFFGMILWAAVLLGCSRQSEKTMIADLIEQAQKTLAPDRRTAIFHVTGDLQGQTLTLRGEIHSSAMKEELLRFLRGKVTYGIVDSLAILPQTSLGDKTLGIVSVSVANIRSRADNAAEMANQALLGTPVRLLKGGVEGWVLVQTPDEYLGWTKDNIVRMTQGEYDAWAVTPKVIVTTEFTIVRSGKEEGSVAVSDVVIGDLLALEKVASTHYLVRFPDGRRGYLAKAMAEPFVSWLLKAEDEPERIVATAKRFFGVPYLWGGTSSKGMDCSGFTKMVYFLNGVLLPRDASQQAKVGIPVDLTQDFASVRPGDLLFFGTKATDRMPERVTHVAISLGGKRFIHASSYVQTNSLDPADPDYSEDRTVAFLGVRRMIGADERDGVRRLATIPYYRATE
jgi:hypothetical protein